MLCKNTVRWLYKLDSSHTWDSQHPVPEDLVFRDEKGKVRLIIETTGRITITRGYAWNGCSPKFCFWDVLLGTPDGAVHREMEKPKTYYASLVHDALYQFLPDGLPLRRRHADRFFLRLLEESEFGPRWVYWVFVRLFGGFVRVATKRTRHWEGTPQQATELLPPA